MFTSEPIRTVREPIIVSVHEFDGAMRLDIRHFYRPQEFNADLKQSQKGINILTAYAEAFVKAVKSVCDGSQSKIAVVAGKAMIIVSKSEFHGYTNLDLRHYFSNSTGTLAPTKKGVSIPWDQRETLVANLDWAISAMPEEKHEIAPIVLQPTESRFAQMEV